VSSGPLPEKTRPKYSSSRLHIQYPVSVGHCRCVGIDIQTLIPLEPALDGRGSDAGQTGTRSGLGSGATWGGQERTDNREALLRNLLCLIGNPRQVDRTT
jgi:hypothetical protein